jgi:hypothetical protein
MGMVDEEGEMWKNGGAKWDEGSGVNVVECKERGKEGGKGVEREVGRGLGKGDERMEGRLYEKHEKKKYKGKERWKKERDKKGFGGDSGPK